MKRVLTLVVMVVVGLALNSCQFLKRNVAVMRDTVSTARADDVMVEKGKLGTETQTAESEHVGEATSRGGSYIVQKGETLSGIARKHGVSVAELRAANRMTGTDEKIRSGQTLVIPGGSGHATVGAVATKTHTGGGGYTIKPGDTLSGIAARHHTTVSAILKANGLSAGQADRIRDGQVLKMPAGKR